MYDRNAQCAFYCCTATWLRNWNLGHDRVDGACKYISSEWGNSAAEHERNIKMKSNVAMYALVGLVIAIGLSGL